MCITEEENARFVPCYQEKPLAKPQQNNPNISSTTDTNRRTTTNSAAISAEAVNNLEEIINFFRQNLTMALGIHQQLTQSPTSKQQRTLSNRQQTNTNQMDALTVRQSAQTPNIVQERTQQQTTSSPVRTTETSSGK